MNRLTAITPATFDNSVDEEFENELPKGGVCPGDTEFEQELEDEVERYGQA